MKIEKTDLFRKLIEEGNLKESGLGGLYGLTPYRIFEFQGKDFKLILKEVKLKPLKVLKSK